MGINNFQFSERKKILCSLDERAFLVCLLFCLPLFSSFWSSEKSSPEIGDEEILLGLNV